MNYKDIDWQDIYDSASVIQRAADCALMAGTYGNPELTKDELEDIINTIKANMEDIQNDTDNMLFNDDYFNDDYDEDDEDDEDDNELDDD